MLYLAEAQHTPDLCPTSNAKTRKKYTDLPKQLPTLTRKHKAKTLGIYVLGLSHKSVIVVDAPNVEAVRDLLHESGLGQINTIDVYPAWTMEEAMKHVNDLAPIPW